MRRLGETFGPDTYSLYDLASPGTVAWAAAAVVVLGLIVFFGAVRGDDQASFTLGVVACLLLSPIVWLHYFSLLIVPLGDRATAARPSRGSSRWRTGDWPSRRARAGRLARATLITAVIVGAVVLQRSTRAPDLRAIPTSSAEIPTFRSAPSRGRVGRSAAVLSSSSVRICIVYDCLYPYTIGGAERFYRDLAEGLAAEGHEVTYLTLRQWGRAETGEVPGVRVVTAGPRHEALRRRQAADPAAARVRRRRAPASAAARARLRPRAHRLVPVLRPARRSCRPPRGAASSSPSTGPRCGRARTGASTSAGSATSAGGVQRRCIRVRQQALCPSELHARRLRDEGARGPVIVYRGLYAGAADVRRRSRRSPSSSSPAATSRRSGRPPWLRPLRWRASRFPELRGEIFGDGPDRPEVLRQIAEAGLDGVVEAPGFVSPGADRAVTRAGAVPAAAVAAARATG